LRIIKQKKIVDPDAKVGFFSMIISSGFFVGYIPKASGTFGSFLALLFYILIPGFDNFITLTVAIILSFILGVFTSDKMVCRYGEDPSVVVIDEFAGMWLTLLFTNYQLQALKHVDYLYYLAFAFGAFLIFRIFDILKIQPAKYLERRFNNGYGVMLDDIVSGLYAGVVAFIIIDYSLRFIYS
jgi:phosphatidylglycerophosphatase A